MDGERREKQMKLEKGMWVWGVAYKVWVGEGGRNLSWDNPDWQDAACTNVLLSLSRLSLNFMITLPLPAIIPTIASCLLMRLSTE